MSQFNFGGPSTTGGGFTFAPAKTTTTTTPGAGFSFSTSASGGRFNFGTPSQPTTSTSATRLFSLTTSTSTTQIPSFSLRSQATPTPGSATPGFSLGLKTSKLNVGCSGTPFSSCITGGCGFGKSTLTKSMASNVSNQTSMTTNFIFGLPPTIATQPTSSIGFSFPSRNVPQTRTTGFDLGSMRITSQPKAVAGLTSAATTPISTAATFTQARTTFSLGGQSTGLEFGFPSLGSTAVPTGTLTSTFKQPPALTFDPKLSTIVSVPTTPSASTQSLSARTSSTPLGAPDIGTLPFGSKLPRSTVTTSSNATITVSDSASTSGFALNLKSFKTPSNDIIPSSSVTLSPVTPIPRPRLPMNQEIPPSQTPVKTYIQLESLINKWSLELEDQEKNFLHQATQVNAWERTLIENGEKITSLHRDVEKVKLDQKRLDQELDFALSQQKELEDLLAPLEEAVKEQRGTIYLHYPNEEREKTYKLAENIDAQLKRMAQDLKNIIEHLNTTGGFLAANDPLQQICKILNAHMDLLQWIDQNSVLLKQKVEEVWKGSESREEQDYIMFD
ncbi:nuclear pore glycoprotein p62-like [Macrotis lagotis]|uniref:nuclear pore glycoprotein p62-like n=1 Tax=Macrotis lagotis TaxID=92651 RepID=UPI003D68DC53